MKKVKSFLHILKQSFFPSVVYYKKLARINFILSIKYFILLVLVLNLILILSLTIKNNPKKINSLIVSIEKMVKEFPEDYAIYIKKGSLTTPYDKPKFFWIDYLNNKTLLLMVDRNGENKNLKTYRPLFFLNNKELIVNLTLFSSKLKPMSFPNSNIDYLVIDKKFSLFYYDLLNSIKKFFIPLYLLSVLFISFILIFFSLLTLLIYLLISTFSVFLIFRFFLKRRFYFRKTFQIGMHAITFPLVLNYFLMIFPQINLPIKLDIPLSFFPLAYFFIILIFIFAGNYFAHLSNHDKI